MKHKRRMRLLSDRIQSRLFNIPPFQLKPEVARAALSLMHSLSDEDTKGNTFSSVIIADAAIDPSKQDPAFATIVVLPEEIVLVARPLTEDDRKSLHFSVHTKTQELEEFAVRQGLAVASEKLNGKMDKSALLISDCLTTVSVMNYAQTQIPDPSGMHVCIRHPVTHSDKISSDHLVLHNAMHDVSQYARKRGRVVELRLDRPALETIGSPQVARF